LHANFLVQEEFIELLMVLDAKKNFFIHLNHKIVVRGFVNF